MNTLPPEIVRHISLYLDSFEALACALRLDKRINAAIDRAVVYAAHTTTIEMVKVVKPSKSTLFGESYRVEKTLIFGLTHSLDDKPAALYYHCADGQFTKSAWYDRGKKHRAGGKPTVVYTSGTLVWHHRGLVHRDRDLPAVVYHDGTKYWYRRGQLHCEGDKPDKSQKVGDMTHFGDREGTRSGRCPRLPWLLPLLVPAREDNAPHRQAVGYIHYLQGLIQGWQCPSRWRQAGHDGRRWHSVLVPVQRQASRWPAGHSLR